MNVWENEAMEVCAAAAGFGAGTLSGAPEGGPEVKLMGARTVGMRRMNAPADETDWVAEEAPVALVYNGISHAVMMAVPKDLEAFGLGFSLSEGIIPDASCLYDIEARQACGGYEVSMRISSECFWKLKDHRRSMAGRTGCGICGSESLRGVTHAARPVGREETFSMRHYEGALRYLKKVEQLGSLTGCTHAAVWISPDGSLAGGAEDVGRHVALDKLLGMRVQKGWRHGALLISSRASFEMVQKAALCGVEILLAVSAPTGLAIDLARKAGMTLAGFCRRGSANVYSHPERLIGL